MTGFTGLLLRKLNEVTIMGIESQKYGFLTLYNNLN